MVAVNETNFPDVVVHDLNMAEMLLSGFLLKLKILKPTMKDNQMIHLGRIAHCPSEKFTQALKGMPEEAEAYKKYVDSIDPTDFSLLD